MTPLEDHLLDKEIERLRKPPIAELFIIVGMFTLGIVLGFMPQVQHIRRERDRAVHQHRLPQEIGEGRSGAR